MKCDRRTNILAIAFLIGVNMANLPVTVPYSGEGNPIYDGMSSLAKGVFQATSSVTCPLYRDYPSFMTGEMFNSPFSAQTDSLLNDLCSPRGETPPPAPPPNFTGGQCDTLYDVRYGVGSEGSSPAITALRFASGPVRGIVVRTSAQNAPLKDIFVLLGPARFGANWTGEVRVGSSFSGNPVAFIQSATREDGLPDTCGNPSPIRPQIEVPDANLNVNVPVQISPSVNITVPVAVFAPITQIIPTLRVGPFNVDFDLGGLTISPGIDINFPGTNPTGNPKPQPPAGQKPSEREGKCDLTEVMKYLKRIRECQECDSDYDFLNTPIVSGNSGSITVPANGIPLTVGLELIKAPSNRKYQPGMGQPDVEYAGWGWFDGNGFMFDRDPIDSNFKLFYAPKKPSVQVFRWTCQNGYEARAIMGYKRLKNPLPPL